MNTQHRTKPLSRRTKAGRKIVRKRALAAEARSVLAGALGTFTQPSETVADALRQAGYDVLPEEVTMHMRDTRPKQVAPERWAHIRAFVTDSVALTLPKDQLTARLYTSTAAIYVAWVVFERGYPLKASIVWRRDVIDEWVREGAPHLTDATRRNYRTSLSRIADVVGVGSSEMDFTRIPKENTAFPYTRAEMLVFRDWATGQSTPLKVRRGMLMLILCAGAGLTSSEVALVRPEDVHVSDAGILIDVCGTNPRAVPLLAEWDAWMLTLLRQKPPSGKPLWGELRTKNKSRILSTFTMGTIGNAPRGDRLRNTWLIALLNARAPMREVFQAAGVRKLENLGVLLDFAAPVPPDEYLAALRGVVSR